MVDRPGWAPDEVDVSRPGVARACARNVLAVMPDLPLRLLEPGLARVSRRRPQGPHDVDEYPGHAGLGRP